MVVDRHGEDLLGAILVDDVFVQIFLDDMGLVLGEDVVQLDGKILLFLGGIGGIVFFEDAVDLLDAALADGESRVGIKDGHIVLAMHRDDLLAEAALVLRGIWGRH